MHSVSLVLLAACSSSTCHTCQSHVAGPSNIDPSATIAACCHWALTKLLHRCQFVKSNSKSTPLSYSTDRPSSAWGSEPIEQSDSSMRTLLLGFPAKHYCCWAESQPFAQVLAGSYYFDWCPLDSWIAGWTTNWRFLLRFLVYSLGREARSK